MSAHRVDMAAAVTALVSSDAAMGDDARRVLAVKVADALAARDPRAAALRDLHPDEFVRAVRDLHARGWLRVVKGKLRVSMPGGAS